MHAQIRLTIHGMRIFIALLLGSALLFVGLGAQGAATLPTLPQATVDTTYSLPTGTTHRPANSAAFATALTNAALNDVIVLTAGVTYTGPFTLPNKTTGSGWIYIVSSALGSLPPVGARVGIADGANMPVITASAPNSAIVTADTAHHFRFVGIQFQPGSGSVLQTGVVVLGNSDTSTATLPHHIIFDRCYLHGDATNGGRRGIAVNGDYIGVVESYISNFWEAGSDSNAIWGYNGRGPFKIYNNYLEAASENVMFGAADPAITNLVPSDITIQRNTFFKPLAWVGAGKNTKNLLEFKNGRRILIEGNIFQNVWQDAQSGFAIVITPRNSFNIAPWSTVEDLTIRYNKFTNVGQGFQISGTDDAFPSQITNRVLIEQNLILVNVIVDESNRIFQIGNPVSQAAAGPNNLTIRHNTGLILTAARGASMFLIRNGATKGDLFDGNDNLLHMGNYGVFDVVKNTEGTAALTYTFTNYTFTKNAITGSSGTYPAGNFFPANNAAVGFVDFAGGNYALTSASSLHNAASDGTDVGANIAAIAAAISGPGIPILPAPKNLRVQ